MVEARGDVWTLPAENGSPRNLTRSSGARPSAIRSGSPDGTSISYFSDETGEYINSTSRRPTDSARPRRLTEEAFRYLYQPAWAPDSDKIAFWGPIIDALDVRRRLLRRPGRGREGRLVSVPLASVWSHDSGWIAYYPAGEDITSDVAHLPLRRRERRIPMR